MIDLADTILTEAQVNPPPPLQLRIPDAGTPDHEDALASHHVEGQESLFD